MFNWSLLLSALLDTSALVFMISEGFAGKRRSFALRRLVRSAWRSKSRLYSQPIWSAGLPDSHVPETWGLLEPAGCWRASAGRHSLSSHATTEPPQTHTVGGRVTLLVCPGNSEMGQGQPYGKPTMACFRLGPASAIYSPESPAVRCALLASVAGACVGQQADNMGAREARSSGLGRARKRAGEEAEEAQTQR